MMAFNTQISQKIRLDHALVSQGKCDSRARAQALIKAGKVTVNNVAVLKPAFPILAQDVIHVVKTGPDYVSRGGYKLQAALDQFKIDPRGWICLDLGASTGGFSDVLLRAQVAKIYAVDVGHGQLHPKIRAHQKVINLEKLHAKDLNRQLVADPIDLLVCDVSFISLQKALSVPMTLLAYTGYIVALIKPQFELGPQKIGKGGLVMATQQELETLRNNMGGWFEQQGFSILGIVDSPITGGDGNKEYLIGAAKKTPKSKTA